eukprot:3783799-Amphidinium_carterae.1
MPPISGQRRLRVPAASSHKALKHEDDSERSGCCSCALPIVQFALLSVIAILANLGLFIDGRSDSSEIAQLLFGLLVGVQVAVLLAVSGSGVEHEMPPQDLFSLFILCFSSVWVSCARSGDLIVYSSRPLSCIAAQLSDHGALGSQTHVHLMSFSVAQGTREVKDVSDPTSGFYAVRETRLAFFEALDDAIFRVEEACSTLDMEAQEEEPGLASGE